VKRFLLLTAVLSLALASSASAEWFFTLHGARLATKSAVQQRYGYGYATISAACRPQGVPFNPSFKYHRWVCGWAHGSCGGVLAIRGQSPVGRFLYVILRGETCN
jgi:hypothetical protein